MAYVSYVYPVKNPSNYVSFLSSHRRIFKHLFATKKLKRPMFWGKSSQKIQMFLTILLDDRITFGAYGDLNLSYDCHDQALNSL